MSHHILKRITGTLAAALLGAAAPAAHSQTIYVGPAAANWDTGTNWTTGVAPTAAEVAVIDARAQNSYGDY